MQPTGLAQESSLNSTGPPLQKHSREQLGVFDKGRDRQQGEGGLEGSHQTLAQREAASYPLKQELIA